MGWFAGALVALSPWAAMGEIGPALTGLTGLANDATSVFFSPAGISRLDWPEVVAQATYGDGSVKLEEDGTAFGYMLGAMYQFTPKTRIGTVYRSSVKPDLDGTPSFQNLDPLLREGLAALNLLGTEVDVDFTVPAQAQVGVYTEFSNRWSLTGDLLWINMSEFGITNVRVTEEQISAHKDDRREMWIGTAGVKYRYADQRAVSFGALYATSPTGDSRRILALPFDRIFSVGAGIELPCFGFVCHTNLNYIDLGDGDVSEDGGPLLGSVDGSFSTNWAVALDFQITMRF